jgi:hypothetical protein
MLKLSKSYLRSGACDDVQRGRRSLQDAPRRLQPRHWGLLLVVYLCRCPDQPFSNISLKTLPEASQNMQATQTLSEGGATMLEKQRKWEPKATGGHSFSPAHRRFNADVFQNLQAGRVTHYILFKQEDHASCGPARAACNGALHNSSHCGSGAEEGDGS